MRHYDPLLDHETIAMGKTRQAKKKSAQVSRSGTSGPTVKTSVKTETGQIALRKRSSSAESDSNGPAPGQAAPAKPEFPFTAIVGQEEMKLALICASIDPALGGVLIFGHRGTGKSTVVRSLSALLPPVRRVLDCPYNCDPEVPFKGCKQCQQGHGASRLPSRLERVPVVDLPLGATEDRIVGALDLERALIAGEKAFEPGLLARANRGFLYIDEVNLLEDHLVDLLLDVAASGENVVEREGLSIRHPARFVLIGSGNPEEGELRPQLLDRYGLSVEVTTPQDIETRMEVVRRRDAYEQNPQAFAVEWKHREARLRGRIKRAREHLAEIAMAEKPLRQATELCLKLGCDGLRGELTLMRAARALASFEQASEVTEDHLCRIAAPALRHRLRRNPLDETGSSTRVARAIEELFGS
ncbi:MAG: magnesium chelatase ATPase subunit I [Gammaproteobacteria bacterium]|nr:magnesium chelatase ATPase subunit I [Gammaproteobacteria bacterium]